VQFKQEIHSIDSVNIHLLHYEAFDPGDYLDHLTEQETERYFTFTHIKRKMEFVATRILRHRIFGFTHIHYDAYGAPYIEGEGFISISHAKGLVGIAFSKDFPVGLDLEKIDTRLLKLCSKFLSLEEKESLNTSSALEMTKVWSGKEALYKIAGRKGIIFSTELHLSLLENNRWKGRIHSGDKIHHTEISIFTLDDLVVSVNINALQEE
jgi:4'-phosphopantetheinyl transferase